jgi:hypothetical protein
MLNNIIVTLKFCVAMFLMAATDEILALGA